jgi:hypothetical protein
MRRVGWLIAALVGCAEAPSAPELETSAGSPQRQEVALVPESDAVRPAWFEGELRLADGAVLTVADHVLELDTGEGPRQVVPGELTGPPSISADRTRVAFAHSPGEDPNSALVVLRKKGAAWVDHTVLDEGGAIDRVALHPDGSRVAFVWAGPSGGVSAIWTLDLPDGAPVRRTNKAPFTPGRPPADFLPLPLGAPEWQGELLRWTSPEGSTHQVEVPR